MDIEMLNSDIKTAIIVDQTYKDYLNTIKPKKDGHWMININSHLCFEKQIFVPKVGDLQLHILRTKHDHILVEHPEQAKTLQLVH